MVKQPIPRGYAFDVLRRVVKRRYDDVTTNLQLKQTDRWDLSNCFYLTRKILDGEGYDTAPLNDRERRESIHSKVREICENELGIKRHEIGIFAAERAVMAFQGDLYNVNIDNINWLKELGTDLIIVEKEGIVDKLVPFTTEFGIAMLYSRGFVSEYGEMLAEEAELSGANIGIVTDFDASGVDIGAQLTQSGEDVIKRLGIDIGSISECLEIGKAARRVAAEVQIGELAESALTKNGTPSDNWTGLANKIRREGSDFAMYDYLHRKIGIIEPDGQKGTITYLDYLKTRRIELNTLVDVVGAQVFWDWLKKKTLEVFPNRNYNRAITIPAYIYTPTMLKFQEKLKEMTKAIMANKVSKLMETLEFTEGLKVTEHVSKQIKTHLLNKVVLKDRKIKRIDYALDELMDRLDANSSRI